MSWLCLFFHAAAAELKADRGAILYIHLEYTIEELWDELSQLVK